MNKNTLVWVIIVLTLVTSDVIHIGINEITGPGSFISTNIVLLLEINMETLLTLH